MQVSCSVPRELASENLIQQIEDLGIQPIITSLVVRAVYEGEDRYIGESIVDIFSNEEKHEITVHYSKKESQKSERRAARKKERAEKNARLHGHYKKK